MFMSLIFTLALLTSSVVPAADAPLPVLRLSGPATIVSYPLFRMMETSALSPWVKQISFRHWKTPDQLRALVISGDVDISAVPTNVAAIFYNRGEPVKLLNVSVWNLLWLISREPSIEKLADLHNKPLLIPYRNDMPDLAFRLVAGTGGTPLEQQYSLRYTANPIDIVQQLLAGRADHAILPEPAASMLLVRNRQQTGKPPLYRSLSLATLWKKRFPHSPEMPQAGLMAGRSLVNHTALLQAVNSAYAQATAWCTAQPDDCARLAHKYLPHLPVTAAADAIRNSGLTARSAGNSRAALEHFFQQIGQQNPARIGGKLPDSGFYLP